MDIFDNCRICMQAINHEPIKMTRIIIKFMEHGLQLKSVARHFEPNNVKQNLCAACFNKLSDFQDFHEQCRESDEFWQLQFKTDKQNKLQRCLQDLEEDVKPCIYHTEVDKSSTNERSLVKEGTLESIEKQEHNLINEEPLTSEQQELNVILEETPANEQHELDVELQEPVPSQPEVSTSCPSIAPDDIADSIYDDNDDENLENIDSADLDDWQADDDDDEEETEVDLELQNDQLSTVDQEVIEFEYELQQDNGGNAELCRSEAPSSTIMGTESQSEHSLRFEFEEIEANDESCDTLIQESYDDYVEDQTTTAHPQEDQTENAFVLTTTIDSNGRVKKGYQCQHCDRSFDRIYDIESHYNIHTDVKPYVCCVCGRSFRQKNILTTHQVLHFGKKVECPECGKKFARRSQLILHFRMHRDEKPFVCDFEGCDAAFRQRQHLVDHSFIHTGEKNFQCSSCTKAFHTRKRLQDHMYKVHSLHRYGCDMCDRAFLKPHMLKNHLSNVHNVELNDVSHLKMTIEPTKSAKRSRTNT